jgi:hypothetical protein
MEKDRRPILGRCVPWALGALVWFAGCVLLASRPGLPDLLKIALAAIGYIGLVLLLGCTLRAWRDDWSELWFPPKTDRPIRRESASHRAALVFRARQLDGLPSRH